MSKYDDELVTWSRTFEGGIKLIDDQHKGLINLCNDLFKHCVGDKKSESEYFKSVVKEAVAYVKEHFATEERIMLATKYGGYSDHKREHDKFVLQVVELVKEFNKTQKIDLFVTTKFLKDWILSHIAITDKLMFSYFKQIATRKADGRLSISKSDVNNN
jgi:hemerythrin